MESWSFVSGGKGFVSNGTISSSDNLATSRNEIVGWDLKSPCGFGNNMLVSGQQAMESQGFGELARQELIEKQLPDTPIRDALSSRLDGGKISDSFAITPNTFSLEDESNSRLSSSVVDSNSKESSFIDLKLGRFGDPRDASSSGISRGNCVVSSSESCTPPKRARGGMNSHTAHCQVYGCNKDLSSSKEYHKRHKVCEVHSKAPKVIVNGIEQRFCQQCSRFHLLAEFDDCKRSCRKRLAGHNERRRKPQVGIQSGRTGRPVQSYNGYAASRFHGTASTATSFICQDILPSSLLHSEKYETNDWSRRIKVEDGTSFSSLLAIPITSGQMHSKSSFTSNNFDKVFPAFHDNGANMASGSVFNANSNQYNLDLPGSNSGSRSLLHGACLGNEEFTTFDTASTIQGFSGITDSGCALSLLSSQSQNSSSHSSAIHVARPLVPQGSNAHYNMAQVSEKLMGVSSSQASASPVLNKYSALRINSADGNHMSPILISDGAEGVNFGITNGIYQDSHFVNAKDRLSPDNSTTIDLLQLSSQLQRVEHQKQSLVVKQENDAFCCPTVT